MSRPGPGPVRLRGHHLLCVLTYVGRGYTPRFVEGMTAVVDRLAAGARVEITEGPDDICAGLLAEEERPHCLDPEAAARDRAALASLSDLLGTELSPGRPADLPDGWPERLRPAFAAGVIRPACAGCSWEATCTEIAAGGFSGARLERTAPPLDPQARPNWSSKA